MALINLGYDVNLDGVVYTPSIDTITSLDISMQNIASLIGIQDFYALTSLNCSYNNLTGSVSPNLSNGILPPFLTSLNCSHSNITSLDVSNNTALDYLDCYDNVLTSLNVSYINGLTYLNVGGNFLTSLDVSNNTALDYLNCFGNQQITNLDVSNNISLEYLNCGLNQLVSLDVSDNIFLDHLNCEQNQITSLDVSQNTDLTALYCWSNQLTSLDLRNGNNMNMNNNNINVSNNPNLSCINVDDTTWSNANWTSGISPQHYFSVDCNAIFGCTDILACNYDTSATSDDGSCIYPPITSIILGSIQTTFLSVETYNVGQNSGSIFNWHLDAGGIFISGQTTNSIEVQWGSTSGIYDLYVIETDINGCIGDTVFLSVTVGNTSNLENQNYSTKKKLIKITDMLGQETPYRRNIPLFYLYDDGTVEKRIVIE